MSTGIEGEQTDERERIIEALFVEHYAFMFAAARKASMPVRVSLPGTAVLTLHNIDRLRVQIRPTADGIANPPALTPIAADGTFRIDNLRDGSYQVSIVNLPQRLYVKSARGLHLG